MTFARGDRQRRAVRALAPRATAAERDAAIAEVQRVPAGPPVARAPTAAELRALAAALTDGAAAPLSPDA